ncbi:LisH domain-containing protein armc9 [Phlyctochytrium planicorne]|nr:LisH domain-containing protein armc9 [Phlyctochytrium planicorne]
MFLDAEKEIAVNRLIREYLNYSDYPTSLSAFDVECRLKGRGADESIPLEDGPQSQETEFVQKITLQKTMEAFKHFLETRGADLCKTTQFLSFYALPYVPDPRKHPSFGELFADRYTRELEDRLKHFLGMALKAVDTPRLLNFIYSKENPLDGKLKESNLEIKALKKKIREYEESETDLKLQHRGLYEDYHTLITIASELVQTLAAAVNGEKITTSYLSGICQRLATFKNNKKRSYGGAPEDRKEIEAPKSASRQDRRAMLEIEAPAHKSAQKFDRNRTPSPKEEEERDALPSNRGTPTRPSPISSAKHDMRTTESTPKRAVQPSPAPAERRSPTKIADLEKVMDYQRLKLDLSMGTDEEEGDGRIRLRTLVLQALRLIVSSIFASESPFPKEQLARLMNAMASECSGRDYILRSGSQIASSLYSTLKNEIPNDSVLFQNLIGTLQKLSLRRQAQTLLNRLNTIDLLLDILGSSDSFSEYSVEYSMALLMNLCLRSAGRKQCLKDPERVLQVLADLLQMDNPQILTYVNGTLYSLLAEPDIRECAREMRFDEILGQTDGGIDEGVHGQIEFVLEQLASDEQPDNDTFSEDGEEEDQEEEDDDDEPLDEEGYETIFELLPNESIKEALLISRYGPSRPPASTVQPQRRGGGMAYADTDDELRTMRLDKGKAREEMRRPKTPQSRPITPASPGRGISNSGGAASAERQYQYGSVGVSPVRRTGASSREVVGSMKSGNGGMVKGPSAVASPRAAPNDDDFSTAKPVVVKTNRRAGNAPVTEDQMNDFAMGFSTKPKIPRTPDF